MLRTRTGGVFRHASSAINANVAPIFAPNLEPRRARGFFWVLHPIPGNAARILRKRGFGGLVDRAHRCLILTRGFIVSVIVVIFGATRRVRGENPSLKL